jgi:SAM-dependent methyltransferase
VRVLDLDRDMRDVIPTGTSRDSEFLFSRMTERTLALAAPAAGRRVLDVASGLGQDALAMAQRGAFSVAAEPSSRMMALSRMASDASGGLQPRRVRGWGDALPFASDCFDAVICKGSLDHFDRPAAGIAEMARVTRPDGRVVLAIANFDSLSCRIARARDGVREGWLRRPTRRGRRFYDVPSDHFTRYELPLMREQASASLELEVVEGVSLLWGLPGWLRLVGRLPETVAAAALATLDALARRLPAQADVVVLAGRPRRSRAADQAARRAVRPRSSRYTSAVASAIRGQA